MSNKSKKIIGGMSVLAFVALVALSMQNGSMKGLNGRDLTGIEPAAGEKVHSEKSDSDVPHTDEVHDAMPSEREHDHGEFFDWDYTPPEPTKCGVYEHWIAKDVDEEAIKETGKIYRIIPVGGSMTMDHNPERINVYINTNGMVLDVKCG